MGNQWASCSELIPCTSKYRQRIEYQEKIQRLQKGIDCQRKKKIFGIGSSYEEITIYLNENVEKIVWKPLESKLESKEVELTEIKSVTPKDKDMIVITSVTGDVLLELKFTSMDTDRDEWVTDVQYVCEHNESILQVREKKLSTGQKMKQFVQDTADRQKYWLKRQKDLINNQKEAAERKKKFSSVGMKYTAIAISNRNSVCQDGIESE